MKLKTTLLLLFVSFSAAFGQFLPCLSNLKTNGEGIHIAELTLIHRSRENNKDINEIGSKTIIIPRKMNGQELKIEKYRFRTQMGKSFEMDNKTFTTVSVYYNYETNDPRDDFFLGTYLFQVSKVLLNSELKHYQDLKILRAKFKDAIQGVPTTNEREGIKVE